MIEMVEDLALSAGNMVDGAIAVSAGRLHLEDPSQALTLLIEHDATALEYFRHELSHQIAMALMRFDGSVQAVYKEHELPEAEEFGTPQLRINDPLYLVVYSERETVALRSLICALDRSLVDALSEHCGQMAPGLINAEIINPAHARRVYASAGGFRPPPVKLVSRVN